MQHEDLRLSVHRNLWQRALRLLTITLFESSRSLCPVPRSTMEGHNCDYLNLFRFDLINDPVRKAVQETSPCTSHMVRPSFRHFNDTANTVFQFGEEVDA